MSGRRRLPLNKRPRRKVGGGDIRAWDGPTGSKSIEDGGDVQRRRHPYGLAMGIFDFQLMMI
ncbi:hypothetical protein Taro_032954 [Colocasia esculenta]|uniref:Uncharacterized protein n=1 Tax=Colocasia esculenta TaxID=4460 RepID=A0A843W3D1_COLES|nr:hypothetical protein [Colocasia esculenta]